MKFFNLIVAVNFKCKDRLKNHTEQEYLKKNFQQIAHCLNCLKINKKQARCRGRLCFMLQKHEHKRQYEDKNGVNNRIFNK